MGLEPGLRLGVKAGAGTGFEPGPEAAEAARTTEGNGRTKEGELTMSL